MPTTIQTKRSHTASSVPDTLDIQEAELAINTADRKIYSRDDSNNIVTLSDQQATENNAANISTLQTDVSTNTANISTNATNISTAQTDITNIQTDVSTIQGDITTIQGDVTTLETNVTSLTTVVNNTEVIGGGQPLQYQYWEVSGDPVGGTSVYTDPLAGGNTTVTLAECLLGVINGSGQLVNVATSNTGINDTHVDQDRFGNPAFTLFDGNTTANGPSWAIADIQDGTWWFNVKLTQRQAVAAVRFWQSWENQIIGGFYVIGGNEFHQVNGETRVLEETRFYVPAQSGVPFDGQSTEQSEAWFMLNTNPEFEDAPSDGEPYNRTDGAWTQTKKLECVTSLPGTPDANTLYFVTT